MLRAVEAANVEARDVVVELEKRQVKLNIRKSKADQKGVGAWRTLECCGENECERDCPFNLATLALNDLQSNDPHSPLFPDSHGNLVSKVGLGKPDRLRHVGSFCKEIRGNAVCPKGDTCPPYTIFGKVEVVGSLSLH
jgi:hypothetical protein